VKVPRREVAQQKRTARLQAQNRGARGRRIRKFAVAGAIAATVAVAFIWLAVGRSVRPAADSASALAPPPDYAGHAAIDAIPCDTAERVTYHVHAHLAVFVDGLPQGVPEGIGIATPRQLQSTPQGPFVAGGACFYWLHTHTNDGIIHVEGPVPQNFTLGQFFDVWQQPLANDQVGPARGSVYAYLNGQPYAGNLRDVALAAHNVIQLDVSQDAPPPQAYSFPAGL